MKEKRGGSHEIFRLRVLRHVSRNEKKGKDDENCKERAAPRPFTLGSSLAGTGALYKKMQQQRKEGGEGEGGLIHRSSRRLTSSKVLSL